jgi:hypothetical protein
MGYQRSDNRYGSRSREEGRYGRDRSFRDEDERGFFERIVEDIRAYFSDDDDRGWDERRPAYSRRERGYDRDIVSDRDRGFHPGDDPVVASGPYGYGSERPFDAGGTKGALAATIYGGSGRGRGFYEQAVGGAYGAGYGATGGRRSRGGDIHDPHYSEWRSRQIEDLDRDYNEYRREHQSRFEREFAGWREKRQGQRQLIRQVTEHMEVIGSDGEHLGTVDKVRGDRIILTKSDENARGHHHSIPCGWVDRVDDKVVINKNAEEARQSWRDEESRGALFDREGERGEGPHILNRSFSGTY